MDIEIEIIHKCFTEQKIAKGQVLAEHTCKWISELDVDDMPRVHGDTIKSFTDANRTSSQITDLYPFDNDFVIFSQDQINEHAMSDGSLLKERHPGSQGLLSVSRVGFGRDNTEALLAIKFTYGFDAAGGNLYLYNYDGRDWQPGNTVWGYTC